MPVLPANAATESLKIRRDQAFIVLLTIEHPDISTLRFTNHVTNVISNGQTFLALPFELELPTSGDGVPTGRLRIANIKRRIWQYIESLHASPTFTIAVVLPSNVDDVVDSYDVVKLHRVAANSEAIEGDLTQTILINKPLPAARMTPEYFPWVERA